MEPSMIRALKLLMRGPSTAREIASALGLSYSRTAAVLRELVEEGYCERTGRLVALSTNAKTGVLKNLGTRYDLAELLRGPRELLLVALEESSRAEEIQRRTGLAQSTVYQALRHLMAMGVALKHGDLYALNDDHDLKALSDLLRREFEAKKAEPHAILIHSNDFRLKKLPTGKPARGSKTAFSAFAKYGVDYLSPYDYYVEPGHEVSIEEVFIHALRSAESRAEGTMCAVFYLRNIDKINAGKVKSLAKKFDVLSLWVDLQNYTKGLPVHDVEKFLPWDELVEKAAIYGLRVSPPPEAEKIMEVLKLLGGKLDSVVHAYLFGGANMLLRGLKKATKDLDIVVEGKEDFLRLKAALLEMKFRPLPKEFFTSSDRRLNPSGIYVSEDFPRLDLFTKVICNALLLTEEMKARVKAMAFGKLVLHLLSLEDVFLLKSITEREGDLEDMVTIAKYGGGLRWSEILGTYFEEEKLMKRHLCFTMLDNIELIKEREDIAVPIHGPLLRHCVEVGILQALANGATTIRDVRKMIDFPEYTIRNRIEKLRREGVVVKRKVKKRLILAITDSGKEALFQSSREGESSKLAQRR